MNAMAAKIMTIDGQNLPFARDLREALALYARRTWPLNTSGHASQAWGLSKATAANLLKGHASDATVTACLRAGGWRMAAAVMGAVIGHSLEKHLNEELEVIRAERARLVELQEAATLRWTSSPADPGAGGGAGLAAAQERHAGRTIGDGSGGVGA